MDTPDRATARRALDELRPYLAAFVDQHLRVAGRPLVMSSDGRQPGSDVQALLRAVIENWEPVFRTVLPPVARSYAHELRDVRNRWAHEVAFTHAEAARAVDTARQFAVAIGAAPHAISPIAEARGRRQPSKSSGTAQASKLGAATYEFSRLGFKADVIEPLKDGESFRVITPVGTFQMTKREFYRDFANVVRTVSYKDRGLYHYATVPEKALKYLVR